MGEPGRVTRGEHGDERADNPDAKPDELVVDPGREQDVQGQDYEVRNEDRDGVAEPQADRHRCGDAQQQAGPDEEHALEHLRGGDDGAEGEELDPAEPAGVIPEVWERSQPLPRCSMSTWRLAKTASRVGEVSGTATDMLSSRGSQDRLAGSANSG